MTHIFSHAAKFLLTGSLFAFTGCVSSDEMFADGDRAPTHASDRYPITVVHGPHGPRARSPACGHWSKDLSDTVDNASYENLGCAVQANIAAEIADPNTINRPHGVSVKDADAGVGAVERQKNAVNAVTLPSNYTYAP